MGVNLPEQKNINPNPQTTALPLLLGAVMLVVAVVGYLRLAFPEEFPAPKMSPKEEEKLARRLREIDDSEQYALLAEVDGWYPCLQKGRPTCFLRAGEVWKYGVTSKGKFGRYSAVFLDKKSVSYLVQFKGSFSDCLKQEQIKLFSYPYLPENLARSPEDRLPRPPYNPIMR